MDKTDYYSSRIKEEFGVDTNSPEITPERLARFKETIDQIDQSRKKFEKLSKKAKSKKLAWAKKLQARINSESGDT